MQSGPDALDPACMLRVAAIVPTDTLVLLHLSVIHQTWTHRRRSYINCNKNICNRIMSFFFKSKKSHTPVVKRSWMSVAGLDSDSEGIVEGRCEGGGSVVEAGEDWVRATGGWGQIRAGTARGSSWCPGLRITCLCVSHNGEWREEQAMK